MVLEALSEEGPVASTKEMALPGLRDLVLEVIDEIDAASSASAAAGEEKSTNQRA